MNEINCGLTRDLLPMYVDGVCGEESRAAVAAHLEQCGACSRLLAEMQAPLPPVRSRGELNAAAGDFRRVRRVYISAMAAVAVAAASCLANVYGFAYGSAGIDNIASTLLYMAFWVVFMVHGRRSYAMQRVALVFAAVTLLSAGAGAVCILSERGGFISLLLGVAVTPFFGLSALFDRFAPFYVLVTAIAAAWTTACWLLLQRLAGADTRRERALTRRLRYRRMLPYFLLELLFYLVLPLLTLLLLPSYPFLILLYVTWALSALVLGAVYGWRHGFGAALVVTALVLLSLVPVGYDYGVTTVLCLLLGNGLGLLARWCVSRREKLLQTLPLGRRLPPEAGFGERWRRLLPYIIVLLLANAALPLLALVCLDPPQQTAMWEIVCPFVWPPVALLVGAVCGRRYGLSLLVPAASLAFLGMARGAVYLIMAGSFTFSYSYALIAGALLIVANVVAAALPRR